jgi:NADH:ubiquinone oxidoreductase subunit E
MPTPESAHHAPPFDPAASDAGDRLAEARHHVDELPRAKPYLLPALLAAHHALGWLPREAIEYVSERTRVPLSEVYATATAYSELRLVRPDPMAWYVCTGVACDLAGADALLEAAPGQAQRIDCQFLCALAPVVVDAAEQLYGRVTPDDLAERARTSVFEGVSA